MANTLAIISFALNRVYTEYYPSRGYSFNITNSTAIDQKYIQGRSLFENVVQIVDEIFNSYLRYSRLHRAAGRKILQRDDKHVRRPEPMGFSEPCSKAARRPPKSCGTIMGTILRLCGTCRSRMWATPIPVRRCGKGTLVRMCRASRSS